ncbi:MAG: hypothetical protein HUK25_06995 [Treponema sp.]|nr:hypothetical protein [Treponema sp.]
MEKTRLTGIERDLVLQYLIDGNVPVTLTPLEQKNNCDGIQPLSSAVFPVALKGESVKAFNNGKILLENPPQSVLSFAGKNVKVEFYFNRVGLYFTSVVSDSSNGLEILLPESINYIQDLNEKHKFDFTCSLYYECRTSTDVNLNCIPWQHSPLFTRPVWKSIPLENQKKAKKYLEIFVEQAKVEKNAGNGIQLIPVCNFLTFVSENKFESLQDRVKPLSILYVDHERLVLGSESRNFSLISGAEYAVKMCFTLKEGPIVSRDIYVTCRVNKLYNDAGGTKFCADCVYTTIQEEDLRFLYEKATSRLFC